MAIKFALLFLLLVCQKSSANNGHCDDDEDSGIQAKFDITGTQSDPNAASQLKAAAASDATAANLQQIAQPEERKSVDAKEPEVAPVPNQNGLNATPPPEFSVNMDLPNPMVNTPQINQRKQVGNYQQNNYVSSPYYNPHWTARKQQPSYMWNSIGYGQQQTPNMKTSNGYVVVVNNGRLHYFRCCNCY